ncbi:Ankyrin repeat-containing protein [Glarea lozoyensis ATCC 20868]|uniref:Ankyrin repeat-containing protein n=1 Tax=Glarea lozoyensis (strain ATCC 20868 / MF5171) TaxID=1116229 RepID=S3CFW1_GLAL2|nr:Ankyrin repeat-containing protein [Glarea lozoyensis ATCC 20868]EPE24770.1 Ankyrin repeat-containing protein [Glarea lozoyensis ATCC 20868]
MSTELGECVLQLESGLRGEPQLPAAPLLDPTDPTLPPFLDACKEADITIVEELFKGRSATDGSLIHGLYAALSNNRPDVAKYLLGQGVPIDKRVLLETKSQECFQLLIDHGWEVNNAYERGDTILPRVLSYQNDSLVRWLLDQGLNPDLGTPGRYPRQWEKDHVQPVPGSGQALNAAAKYSTPEIFELLISHGANIKNSKPLINAVTSIWLTTSERIKMMEFAVKLGADVNEQGGIPGSGYQGGTPLHGAAVWGRLAEAKWLLEHGANVRSGNKFCRLPWTEATRCARNCRHTEVANYLKEWELKHKSGIKSPTLKIGRGNSSPPKSESNPGDATLTPFLDACKQADISTVASLSEQRDKEDGSLNWGLYTALSSGRDDVANLLLNQGVPVDQYALLETKTKECFQVLLDHGWNINGPIEFGDTILPHVLALKDESLLEWMLSKGLNSYLGPPGIRLVPANRGKVQPVPGSGIGALHAAATHSTPAVLDILISHGLKFENLSLLPSTVASYFLSTTERIAMMEHLLKLGVDVNQKGHVSVSNYPGGTALHAAAFWGRLLEAQFLSEQGADVRRGDDACRLPYTERRGRLEPRNAALGTSQCAHWDVVELLEEWELSCYGTLLGRRIWNSEK